MFEYGHSVLNFGPMCVWMKKEVVQSYNVDTLDRANDDDYDVVW